MAGFCSASRARLTCLNPVQSPRVASTFPPPDGLVALPRNTLTVTFDHDMLEGDPTDPASVLNPANYALVGTTSSVAVADVAYDSATRTAVLTFNDLQADHYELRVKATIQSTDALALAEPYTLHFQALSDLSAQVRITFTQGRADARSQTVSYNMTVTNITSYDLLAPLVLYVDGLAPSVAAVLHGRPDLETGDWWLDLSSVVSGDRLHPGQTTAPMTITFSNPTGGRLNFPVGRPRPAVIPTPRPSSTRRRSRRPPWAKRIRIRLVPMIPMGRPWRTCSIPDPPE